MSQLFLAYLKASAAGYRMAIYRTTISVNPKENITASDASAAAPKTAANVTTWLTYLLETAGTNKYAPLAEAVDATAESDINDMLVGLVNTATPGKKNSVKLSYVDHTFDDVPGETAPAIRAVVTTNGLKTEAFYRLTTVVEEEGT